MRVWEKLNELKGADSTKEQIVSWFYMNRIYPYDVIKNNALELDHKTKLPPKLIKILKKYDPLVVMNGSSELYKMLEEEV